MSQQIYEFYFELYINCIKPVENLLQELLQLWLEQRCWRDYSG